MDLDEDAVLLDVEAHDKYEHVNPGTATVQGYAIEVWEHETYFNEKFRTRDILTAADGLPSFSCSSVLRRLNDMQTRKEQLGYDHEREYEELVEFAGDFG